MCRFFFSETLQISPDDMETQIEAQVQNILEGAASEVPPVAGHAMHADGARRQAEKDVRLKLNRNDHALSGNSLIYSSTFVFE